MSESILTSTKKILGLEEDYTAFDFDVMTHINTAFSKLNQLGVGPEQGFQIEDDTATWDAFLGSNLKYNMVKTYVCLVVRSFFDPPQSSIANTMMKEQIEQFEWRISILREETDWVDPDPDVPDSDDELLVLDGGGV
jgi:hypothetical protein